LKREQRILDRDPGHSTSSHVPPNTDASGGKNNTNAVNATGQKQKTNYKDLGHDWSIGLAPEDILIKQRLLKLKEEPTEQNDKDVADLPEKPDKSNKISGATSDDDLAARVNALRGTEGGATAATQPQSHLPPTKKLTQVEQVDDLLQEIADEVEIDSHLPDPALDVENRLRKLRGESAIGGGGGESTGPSEMKDMIETALNWTPESDPKEIQNEGENLEERNENGSESGKKEEGEKGKTEEEEDFAAANRLMAQMAEELESDAKKELEDLAKDDTVRQRLEELKIFNQKQREKAGEDEDREDDDEEEETRRIIQKLTDEARLEDHDPNIDSSPSVDLRKPLQSLGRQVQRIENNLEGNDPLPWCAICNEDASWSCRDCDGDLYCSKCYRECHREEKHDAQPFKPKQTIE